MRTGEASRVDVRVIDKAGAMVSGARLLLVDARECELESGKETGQDGRATLSDVIGGDVRVIAETPDGRRGTAPVSISAGGAFGVTVVVEPASSIEESPGR